MFPWKTNTNRPLLLTIDTISSCSWFLCLSYSSNVAYLVCSGGFCWVRIRFRHNSFVYPNWTIWQPFKYVEWHQVRREPSPPRGLVLTQSRQVIHDCRATILKHHKAKLHDFASKHSSPGSKIAATFIMPLYSLVCTCSQQQQCHYCFDYYPPQRLYKE